MPARLMTRAHIGNSLRINADRVAIGWRSGRQLRTQRAAGARAIVHDHLLAQCFRKLGGNDTRVNIGAAPRREWHDEGDRPRRVAVS